MSSETGDLNSSAVKPTFNINDALVYVGGFGRLQLLLLILLSFVRNIGMYQTYGFALMVMPQDYNCWWENGNITK